MSHVALLREAFITVKQPHPLLIDAAVLLPDHLHCLWTLPPLVCLSNPQCLMVFLALNLAAGYAIQNATQGLLKSKESTACPSFLHRGRIQVQGAGYKDSEAWSQPHPLTSAEGIAMLDRLVARMPQRVYRARSAAIQKALTWMSNAAQAGGAHALLSKTFLEPGSKDERIDIEIFTGSAFVP